MNTINIAYTESTESVERIRQALDEVTRTDPNWNGADFQIERTDYTSVDTDDEIAGMQLLQEVIFPILRGE